jgi:large subunit ribosomal protein L10
MLRSDKVGVIQGLKDRFDRMTSAVFVDFKGMNVEEVSKLRDTFRAQGVEYKVVKNTLVRQALSEHDWVSGLDDVLTGMTGVAWSYEDPSAAAKVVKAFAKENEKLQIKAGLIEGQVLDAKAVEQQLANMPGKDEMRAQLLALLKQPAETLVRLLNTPATDLVRLLNTPAQNALGVLEAKKRQAEG